MNDNTENALVITYLAISVNNGKLKPARKKDFIGAFNRYGERLKGMAILPTGEGWLILNEEATEQKG